MDWAGVYSRLPRGALPWVLWRLVPHSPSLKLLTLQVLGKLNISLYRLAARLPQPAASRDLCLLALQESLWDRP